MINWQQMINKLEVDMFAAMKILIVCEENAMVAHVAPYEIHQDWWNHPLFWCSHYWSNVQILLFYIYWGILIHNFSWLNRLISCHFIMSRIYIRKISENKIKQKIDMVPVVNIIRGKASVKSINWAVGSGGALNHLVGVLWGRAH